MNALFPLRRVALAIGAASILSGFAPVVLAADDAAPCAADISCLTDAYAANHSPSWIFRRGTFTHDPLTGARVAQYMRTPPVEPLDDERMVTSRYRRSRTNLRGSDGSIDTYYEVQAWGNGRGGIDAEWERFHEAWKESILSGGYYNQGPSYGPLGYGGGFPGGGFAPGFGSGLPGYGFPGNGYGGPGYGSPHGGWGNRNHGGGHHGGGHHGGSGGHGDNED